METWGKEQEWQEDMVAVLRDGFRVSELIFHRETGGFEPEDADIRLEVRVIPTTPRKPEVEASAAVLDVLAYITIPLLPLWIRDVRKDPGLKLELTASFTTDSAPILDREPIVPDLLTSLVERIPFFSWTTLGAILVPPFVFEGEDRSEHMESSIGTRVRRLAAAEVARLLKRPSVDPERLIQEIQVSPGSTGPILSFVVEKEAEEFSIRLGKRTGKPWERESLPLGRKKPEFRRYSLPANAGLVRIEVVSLGLEAVVRCYTIVIDEDNEEKGTPPPPVPEA